MQIAITQENPETVDSLLDFLEDTKRELTAVNKEAKRLVTEKSVLEAQIVDLLDQGYDTDKAMLSILESTEYVVVDWDLSLEYVITSHSWHLLQRRLSAPAVREETEMLGPIPGLSPKTTRKLSIKR